MISRIGSIAKPPPPPAACRNINKAKLVATLIANPILASPWAAQNRNALQGTGTPSHLLETREKVCLRERSRLVRATDCF
jgi:hypothetical protein